MAATLTSSRHDTPFSMSSTPRPFAPDTNMADTLPSIDFNFADLRERMALFTAKFDDFIERGRKRVLEERNAFRLNVAELQESQRAHKRSLATLSTSAEAHNDTLEKEAEERAELQGSIAELAREKEDALVQREELLGQIGELQDAIKQRREAMSLSKRHLEAQGRLNGPELRFWEHALGLRIEGAGVDERVRFLFSCVDERDLTREIGFVLDMGGREWRVDEAANLEEGEVEGVVERLNDSGDLRLFLKDMRILLVQACRG
ncbi:Kinetochore protein spc25 [Sphaceloma murrayae]|uniref:Kinetochore protein SPC25 n=1 Tax=Sphaceloma murrayae TaxID=2082308 RepID=A0A2K1QXG4_9PEZI|nr:Kinetochore protein spc25 [Sphaceloma murrayae]